MSLRNPLSALQRYYRRRSASMLFRRLVRIAPVRPVISFTFDDFPQSALLNGGRILNSFGLAGTYYASFALIGKDKPSGQMFFAEDLLTLFKQGHELGCHTFSHCDSWETKPNAFEKDIIANRAALRSFMPEAEFKSFSYPISLPRPLTKARTARHFLCCRGGGQTFNAGTADLNQLSAFFLEKSRNNIHAIEEVIDNNRKARGWLIFATHDVCNSPSPFGCTPTFFNAVVRHAADSGALILPVSQALEQLLGVRKLIPVNEPDVAEQTVNSSSGSSGSGTVFSAALGTLSL